MGTANKKQPGPRLATRLILSFIVIGLGVSAMIYFSSQKKKPHRGGVKEMVLRVSVKEAVPETVHTRLKGFGVAEPVTTVRLSAEVSGRIVYTHPGFKQGKTIAKGEVLFKIDPSDYQTTLDNLRAGLVQKKAALTHIQKELIADRNRLFTIRRTMDLSRAEYDRVRVLLEENSIGNRSAVDQAEQSMNSAIDTHDQMKRSLSLYPVKIKEAEAAVLSAKADVDKAKTNLARCTVIAPFTCRIKSTAMEMGEYAKAGTEIVILADDSQMEILVSLDAKEATSWLSFQNKDRVSSPGWFPKPEPVTCDIQWIENKAHTWTGTLTRLVEFDQSSRTMTLAVRFDPRENRCPDCPFLVEGMFCRISIPGKPIDGLFRMERWLVTTDNTVYVAEKNRLKTRAVKRIYADGDLIFVTGDIRAGDSLITTRLVDPLENSVLRIVGKMPDETSDKPSDNPSGENQKQ
jgi:multidrug efflux pump subunit AcrA (membrane-fusion protein)